MIKSDKIQIYLLENDNNFSLKENFVKIKGDILTFIFKVEMTLNSEKLDKIDCKNLKKNVYFCVIYKYPRFSSHMEVNFKVATLKLENNKKISLNCFSGKFL